MGDEISMNRKRILVVDDDPVVVKALSLKLKAANFDVLIALDGSEAVNATRLNRPDAILLDINFPSDFTGVAWDGFRILDWLHRIQEAAKTPIFFISSNDPAQHEGRMAQFGVAGYFRKPINHDELINTLHRLLNSPPIPVS